MMKMRWFILTILLCGFVFAVPSVLINGGDTTTDDTSVSLTLSADNATDCNLSNDDSNWTTFTYTTSRSWDLESGDGLKTVYLRCNENGDWSSSESDTIILNTTVPDTTDPVVSSKSPTGNIYNRTPEISADITDTGGSDVDESSIEMTLNGVSVTHDYDSGEVTYTPSSNLDFITYTVVLYVEDNAGNSENASWTFTIKSDGVDVEDIEPADENYTAESRPDIEFTLVDTGSGINHTSLVFTFDDDEIDSDDLDKSGNIYTFYPATLVEGKHTAEISVRDNADVLTEFEWEFYIDTSEPVISLYVPSDGDVVTDAPSVSAMVEDYGSGIDDDALFMEFNGIDVTSAADYDESSDMYVFNPSVELTPGVYTVEIWASDKVGNNANVDWTFSVSSDAPALSSLKPSDGSTVSDSTPEISAKISDSGTSGINVDSIKLYVDGDQVTGDATYNAGSGIVSYTPSDALSDGEHTVRLKVKNNNYDETDMTWEFTLDASAPVSPTSFSVTQDENGTLLEWNCSSSEVDQFNIYGSVTPFTSIEGKATLATVEGDTYEYEHDTTSKYYYAITAEDEHGNECEPLFASTCDVYSDTSGWTDYECCKDADCDTGYTCSVSTHSCRIATGTTIEADADDAIDEAESAIQSAKKAGRNVTKAEDYLEDAQNAFNAENYEQAEHFAQLANDAALSAPKLPDADVEDGGKEALPCCPSTFILLAALGFAALRR